MPELVSGVLRATDAQLRGADRRTVLATLRRQVRSSDRVSKTVVIS